MRRRSRQPRRSARESLQWGIYLIPSLFTVGNMLCGFAAVVHAIHGRLTLAAWLLILAGVLDGLDGRIARLTRATSEFGKEYDSLADVISFGIAPAILIYQWGLWNLGRGGWAVAFLFLVAGSVRLARFNVTVATSDREHFTGLPIPAGAGALSVLVLVQPALPLGNPLVNYTACAFVLLVSLLMVSKIPYRSYKDFNLRRRWPATAFFVLAVAIAVIAVSPVPTMAVLCAAYLLSGPVEVVGRRRCTQLSPATAPLEGTHGEPPPTRADGP
ncbi:MAG: CDP-diacylglycerol--serine O-phosphatidyltransferase [Thermoanaerobaculaceae bacterium]|nr:CDP-diacylglycerol--serine O-phosphatidyltransferase [Thermoanaerobaculaceae bacterium]